MSQHDNSSSKYAFFMDDQTLLNLTQSCQCQPLVLQEQVTWRLLGIGLSPFDYTNIKNSDLILFADIFDGILKRLIPSGVLNHLIDYHTWILYRKGNYKAVETEPRVLTIDDLSCGFVLWLIACGISMIAYLFELARFKFRKKIRILIGLVLFLWL